MAKLKDAIIRFMYGRYGADELYKLLLITALVLAVVNILLGSILIWLTETTIIIWATFRFLSRNTYKRKAENAMYLKLRTKVRQFFKRQVNRIKYRKTKVYKKCPNCKSILCLPRKKGRHTVKCPSCSNRFDIKI